MTSKSLFFKLIREDCKRRLWVPAISVIVFFFTFPVNLLLMISRYSDRAQGNFDDLAVGTAYVNREIVRGSLEWMSASNGFMVFLLCVFAVLCATTGFSYLHSRKKTDFYHSLPIKREKLFAVTFLSGILFTAVPYLLAVIAATVIVQVKTGLAFSYGSVVAGYLVHMAFFFLMYATVVAAVILTGNTIVSLLGTIVFFSWGPAVVALLYAYYMQYYRTFYYDYTVLYEFLLKSSPVAFYISAMEEAMAEAGGSLVKAAWAFVIAVLITLLTLFLYKKRPSEGAGRAMAFKKSQSVIKFLLVVPSALFGSLFMRQMMDTAGWSIFGLLCGLILSYCVIEIIYHFDFRKLFSHRLHLIVCSTVSCAILAFFHFDLSGYDSYLPSADKIESAAILSITVDGDSAVNYWAKPYLVEYDNSGENTRHYLQWKGGDDRAILKNMKLTDTQKVLAIAQKGNEVAMERKNRSSYDARYVSEEMESSSVYVKYLLKSGKEVYRAYIMADDQVVEEFPDIYAQKEYKETVYPILKEDLSQISGINYHEYQNYSHVKLPDASMKERLFTTYREELSALTISVRKEESPIGALQFKTIEMQSVIDQLKSEGDTREYLDYNDRYYYPVYPSFTKTLSLLKECGIEAGTYLSVENVEEIEVTGYGDYYKYEENAMDGLPQATSESTYENNGKRTLIIKDKREIETVLNASVSADMASFNALNKTTNGISVIVYVPHNITKNKQESVAPDTVTTIESAEEAVAYYVDKSEGGGTEYENYSLLIDADKVPNFVKEALSGSFD